MNDDLEAAKEHAWRELAHIDAGLQQGRITEAGWHAAVLEIVEPAYLAGANRREQSGHGGDETGWRQARQLLVDALPGDCSLLDIGCANGHLMESLTGWAAEAGIAVEPYGAEISPRLATLARHQCPQWAERIWTANALGWRPPLRFDLVRTGLDYVPARRRADLLAHLVAHAVKPGGRLLVGTFNEERDVDGLEHEVCSWGYPIAGTTSRPHRHPALAYKAFWIDTDR